MTGAALGILGEPVIYARGQIVFTVQGLFTSTGQPEDVQLGEVMGLRVRTSDIVAGFTLLNEQNTEPRGGDIVTVRGINYTVLDPPLADAGGQTTLKIKLVN